MLLVFNLNFKKVFVINVPMTALNIIVLTVSIPVLVLETVLRRKNQTYCNSDLVVCRQHPTDCIYYITKQLYHRRSR